MSVFALNFTYRNTNNEYWVRSILFIRMMNGMNSQGKLKNWSSMTPKTNHFIKQQSKLNLAFTQELKDILNFSKLKRIENNLKASFILRFQKEICRTKYLLLDKGKKWSSKSGSSWMMMVPPFDWIIRENCWTESEFSFFIFHREKSEEITLRKSKMVFFRNYFRIQFVLWRLVLCRH